MKHYTTNEIKRIHELIVLNPHLEKELIDDIELIKTNPQKYWNSFLLIGEKNERVNHILKMQNIYNNRQQLTLFDEQH